MKKILLGLVMLLTTATMSAQVELEYVFDGYIMLNESAWDGYLIGADDMFVIRNNDKMYIYRSDFTLYGIFDSFDLLTRNIFTMDNKLCFVTIITEGDWPNYKTKITISNEDNETIKEIQLDGFTGTELYQTLTRLHVAEVRSPIRKTNVILKFLLTF